MGIFAFYVMIKIKILIVDNHPITLLGLRTVLGQPMGGTEFEVVGEAIDGTKVALFLKEHPVDVLVLDIEMPGLSGLDLADQIKSDPVFAAVRVLIYTNHNSRVLASEAIARGVDGYVLKDSPTSLIPIAVQKVYEGEFYIDSNLKSKPVPQHLQGTDLSAMERNVICLIVKQMADKEIATKLDISVDAVENHKRSIKKKIGAVNIVGIVLYALEHNLCKSISTQIG